MFLVFVLHVTIPLSHFNLEITISHEQTLKSNKPIQIYDTVDYSIMPANSIMTRTCALPLCAHLYSVPS